MSKQESPEDVRPGAGALPLPFDTWAELSARLMNLGPEARLAILEEHDLDEQGWMRWDEHHCLALAQDIRQGRMDRAESYAQKCAEELERRKVPVEAPATPNEAPSARPSEPEAEATIGAPLEAAPQDTPSFLQPHQAPAQPLARTPKELAATAGVFDLPTSLRNGALPFHKSALPSPIVSQPQSPRPTNTGGETMPLGAKLPLGAVLPFGTGGAEPPDAPALTRMTLQTYASFCAELAVSPDRAAEIETKYNIRSDAARTALNVEWQTRFDAYPATKAEWEGLVAHYREWLQRQASA